MRQEIHLYLRNQEVEFNHPLDLYYNYQIGEVTNPTVVKNGFSKTITIEGTPNNNRLFGEYWNVERVQGDGNELGVRFNPARKVPFQIYYNSEIYESGYAKLDEVRLTNQKDIEYDITLYGGLGDFFFNLSTKDDGSKMKLSDLIFYNPSDPSSEFNFTTNMDTVKEAWDNMSNTGSMWSYINFMPAYNGKAVDFDNNKIICNLEGSEMPTSEKVSGVTYTTYDNNMVLGTLPKDMNEWEVRDLRSYLQRPCIKVSRIIEACCDQQNNGGYQVELDGNFFSTSNPYYSKTWMSLPMLTNLEYTNTQQVLTGQTLVIGAPTGDMSNIIEQEISFSLGDFSSTMKSLELRGCFKFTGLGNNKSTSHMEFWRSGGDSYHTGYALFGSIFVQLVAYNGDTVVDASECYNLTSPIRHNGKLYYGNNSKYSEENQYTPLMDYNSDIKDILGYFKNDYFCDENDDPVVLRFHMQNLSTQITSLRLRYFLGASDDKINRWGKGTFYADPYINGVIVGTISRTVTTNINLIDFDDTYHNFKAVIGGSLGRTGTRVTKDLLLNTEFSPCDFLLNYCKTFGLYFLKDVDYNLIRIYTREKFYSGSGSTAERIDTKNLSSLIDREKPYKITPINFDKKYYKFNYDTEPTSLSERYFNTYGVDYGCRIYDTGFEFNVETKDVLEDNCYKTGIETVGKGRYFSTYSADTYYRTWMEDGFSYTLYNGNNTQLVYPPVLGGSRRSINPNEGYSGYDMFPKLQFHDADENPVDGKYVMAFFSGWKSFTASERKTCKYFLTDDNKYMTALNGGRPCWLFTPNEFDGEGNRLGYKLSKLPVFERYLTQSGSNTIKTSLDFGPPRETYIPYYDYSQALTICGSYWDKYMSDVYSPDNKTLSCYVHIKDKPNPEWLRSFYWFDNCIWRLNKIEDWNISSFDTTKCEFIKVLNPEDYGHTYELYYDFNFTVDDDTANSTGQTITGTITCGGNVKWKFESTSYGSTVSPTSGTGPATVTLTIPALPSNIETRSYYFRAKASLEGSTSTPTSTAVIKQASDGAITVVEGAPYAGRNVPATGGTCNLTVTSTYAWTVKSSRSTVKTYYNGSEVTSATTMPSGTTEIQVVWPAAIRPTKKTISFNRTVLTFKDVYDYSVTWKKEQALAQVINFNPSGGSITIDYESGKRLVLPAGYTYVDNGDDTYTITAQPNYSPSATSQTASFEASDEIEDQTGQQVVYIQINQEAGQPFTITPIVVEFNYSGGTTASTVINTFGDEWSVIGKPNWVSAVTTDNSIVLTTSANTGEDRNGMITVVNTTLGQVYYISCYQEGSASAPQFNVTPSVLTFAMTGGTGNITVSNPRSENWKVMANPSWASCVTASTGVSVSVGYNSGVTRNDNIVITNLSPTGESFNVVCVQGGLTGISIENLTWVTDIQSGGGTATSANTTFTIMGYDDLGNSITLPSGYTVTGSVEVPRDTTRERHTAGTLTLTATYQGFTASASTTIWQMAYIPVLVSIQFTDSPAGSTAITSSVTWTTDVAKTGGTATKANVFYRIIGRTALIGGDYLDLTDSTVVTGSLNVDENPYADRRSAGTLTLTATYDNSSVQVAETAQTTVTVYQEGNPKIELSQSGYMDIPGSGGTGTFTVTSNIPFDIDINDINNS